MGEDDRYKLQKKIWSKEIIKGFNQVLAYLHQVFSIHPDFIAAGEQNRDMKFRRDGESVRFQKILGVKQTETKYKHRTDTSTSMSTNTTNAHEHEHEHEHE